RRNFAVTADDRARTFENDGSAVTLDELRRSFETFALNIRSGNREESPRFTRMRREHPVVSPIRIFREQIESVGVDDHWLIVLERCCVDGLRPFVLSKPWPERDDIGLLDQRAQIARTLDAATDQLRPRRNDATHIVRMRRDRHESRTGAKTCLTRQINRA